jgi:CRP/FNR family transcriptional regulator
MTPEEQHAIGTASDLIQLRRNQVLPSPPPDEPCLYVIKRGHVQLTYSDEQGREAVVILLGPGDVFGGVDPGDTTFAEYCKCLSEACLCRISRSRFLEMLSRYPNLGYALTKFSLLRIRRLQVRLAEMMMRSADERLVLALLDLNAQIGRDEPDGRRKLTIPLTHADLAKLIGTSREMVTILLGRLRKAGLVDSEKGWLYINNLDQLRALSPASPAQTTLGKT